MVLSSVEVKDDNMGASTVMKGDTIKSKDAAGNTSVVKWLWRDYHNC